ncbi:hypothetical protein GGF46_001936 [Coemansia sp. RSA 552]|nr:hypothetical protein GGF46_001936 [Coemansia sp. RSA 552]
MSSYRADDRYYDPHSGGGGGGGGARPPAYAQRPDPYAGMPAPMHYGMQTAPVPMPGARPMPAYGAPQPAPAPKIRHPNRPPCVTPSKTLYVRNLNERTRGSVLTAALQTLFESYGEILEIRARHSIRMRGQAFVTFKEQNDAARAHGEVQGFVLFGKPMFIEFSRMPSEASVVDEGGDIEAFKGQRAEEKERREREAQEKAAQQQYAPPAPETEVPNNILYLKGLPADVDVAAIESAFGAHPGFVEVRWVSIRPDVAFVEYRSEAQAGMAKAALGPQWTLREDAPPVLVLYAAR